MNCDECYNKGFCTMQFGEQVKKWASECGCRWFKNKNDVVEVKHGRWETFRNMGGYEVMMRCSVCAFQFDNWRHIFNYCPYCGAKMDGDSHE